MNTTIIKIDELNIDTAKLKSAGNIIKQGGLVAFPTETVYGLGGDALNPDSSKKIYAAKGRPSDNPLIVQIAKLDDMKKIVESVSESAVILVETVPKKMKEITIETIETTEMIDKIGKIKIKEEINS